MLTMSPSSTVNYSMARFAFLCIIKKKKKTISDLIEPANMKIFQNPKKRHSFFKIGSEEPLIPFSDAH